MQRRRQLSCVRLLLLLLAVLLLAALCLFAAAAAADRELLTVATGGSERDGPAPARPMDTSGEGAAEGAASSNEEERAAKRRRFRTRKVPSGDAKINNGRFDGRVPFTADYSRTHGHPSKHN